MANIAVSGSESTSTSVNNSNIAPVDVTYSQFVDSGNGYVLTSTITGFYTQDRSTSVSFANLLYDQYLTQANVVESANGFITTYTITSGRDPAYAVASYSTSGIQTMITYTFTDGQIVSVGSLTNTQIWYN